MRIAENIEKTLKTCPKIMFFRVFPRESQSFAKDMMGSFTLATDLSMLSDFLCLINVFGDDSKAPC